MERLPSQREKLKCLAEPAKDQKDKVVRKDQFDILPLELLIKVMRFEMAESHYWSDSFVMRCAWVSQSWRQTLINQCPELWNTFNIPARQLKDTTKPYNERRETWIKRSNGRFHRMKIGAYYDITLTCKIPTTYGTYLSTVKDLRISFTDNKALFRFAKRFPSRCTEMQHLKLDGGDMPTAKHRDNYQDSDLHCGILSASSYSTLQSMDIKDVDFSERDIPDSQLDDHYFGRLRTANQQHDVYPALTRLTVSGCLFNVFEADLDPQADNDTRGGSLDGVSAA